ncbi:MAG: GNAT family N-acetyltransferase, partial [Candidatus Heimdallarchaeota archaeon]|nr:GNAT family N-acetyltransferase [Candidatus Heimdallarchaeota archaeon]
MDFTLSEIDGKKIEKDLWSEFHVYRKEYHQAVRPNDPLESDEFAEKSFLLQVANPEWEAFPFVIRKGREGGPVIGLFFYVYFTEASPSYENMKPMMLGHIELLPQYRRKGIGKKLLKIVYEKSIELNKSVIMGNSEELEGRAFVNSFGGKEGVVQFENR